MMCSMMQLEKLLNTMKFFLDFFSWIFFSCDLGYFFLILIFLIFFWFVGEKKQIFLFSGFFDYYLDNFEMTRINAPFSSLNRWLSFFRCSSCWKNSEKYFSFCTIKYYFCLKMLHTKWIIWPTFDIEVWNFILQLNVHQTEL